MYALLASHPEKGGGGGEGGGGGGGGGGAVDGSATNIGR